MRKNRIRLTESQLHNIIKESINRILQESHITNSLNETFSHNDLARGLSKHYDIADTYRGIVLTDKKTGKEKIYSTLEDAYRMTFGNLP